MIRRQLSLAQGMAFILTPPILAWLLASPYPAGAQKRPILIKCARTVAEITLGMRGSGVNRPAAVASDATHRTGESRMLLDDLLAERERVETPAQDPVPHAPLLTIEPVAVPPAGEIGRRAARQRLAALEDAARRNLRAAEEARRVLADEHRRLQEESSARLVAQAPPETPALMRAGRRPW